MRFIVFFFFIYISFRALSYFIGLDIVFLFFSFVESVIDTLR